MHTHTTPTNQQHVYIWYESLCLGIKRKLRIRITSYIYSTGILFGAELPLARATHTVHLTLELEEYQNMGGNRESTETNNGGQLGKSTSTSRRTLVTVFLSLLVDLLGFTVILPLIPSMLEYYSTHDKVLGETYL